MENNIKIIDSLEKENNCLKQTNDRLNKDLETTKAK